VTTKHKFKLYIGCSLTQAPSEFVADIEALKDSLREDFEVLDFIGLQGGTPTDVYHWDVKQCVGGCDLFVAVCDYPAIGLGYELATAIEHYRKPVLAVAHQDATVTRLVLGIDALGFSFQRYDKLSDVKALVRSKMTTLKEVTL
jgi:hypothetical protein